ncbi:putative ankyrin repeat protein RF_0381 [Euwallacea similis]|uniref:putative ankyrin repeat protein RF_0381 n=1 Tax=Euwallacea similis TaxID=1736056 RepID=UPI00344B7C31
MGKLVLVNKFNIILIPLYSPVKSQHEEEFFAAALVRDFDAINNLIERGLDPNIVDYEGMTILQIVAEKEDIPMGTMFHLVLLRSKYRLSIKAKYLLSFKKLNINTHSNTLNGDSALITAVIFNRTQMVSLLLQHGADPNIQNLTGQTALHSAVRKKNLENVKILLLSNAQPNVEDAFGNTPLSLSIIDRHSPDIASLLLKAQADPNFRVVKPQPLLIELALICRSTEHLNMVTLLVKNNANVNIKDPVSGLTSLHAVSITGYVPLARMLLALGASAIALDRMGRTPFDAAIEYEQKGLIHFYSERVMDMMGKISFVKRYEGRALAKKNKPQIRTNVRFADTQTMVCDSDKELFLEHI